MPATPAGKETRSAEDWVHHFIEGWRAPAGAAGVAEHFGPVLDPEVRLIQPQTPTVVGHEPLRRDILEPLFALIPDLRAEVERWATRGDVAFIEFTFHGTLGGKPVSWRTCDRISLRGGLAVEREVYFDPLPLMGAIVTRPRAWPRFLRFQLMQLRRRLRRRSSRR